jgi:RNA polymerase sigma factor (sigma-70 family)
MAEKRQLAERFETHAGRLRAVAYRMLGSRTEADDAVQEAWLRLDRTDTRDVENLGGWLTTVVARVCLDMLRARKSRLDGVPADAPEPSARRDPGIDPEQELLLADSLGAALVVVLDTLAPAERVAFVLHDMFALSFEEIAGVLGRSPAAARQLASRARRRVQGAAMDPDADGAAERLRDRRVLDAFFAASRNGDFDALLAVLDPDIVLRADVTGVRMGAESEVRGAAAVAKFFKGRSGGAQLALVNGALGAVWMPGGKIRVVFDFSIDGETIMEIDLVADRASLDRLDVAVLESAVSPV